MKIIQIIPAFVMGGAEIMCENLIYALKEQNCDVVVISLFKIITPITQRLEKNGVNIVYLDKKYGVDLSMIKKLYLIFRKEKPDAIHMHLKCTAFAIPAAIMAGIKKRVYTLHHIAEKDGGKFIIALNKFFIHHCHMVPVALTEDVRDTVCNVYSVKKEQSPVVLNGIDLNRCVVKKNYEVKDNTVEILHIGRFEEPKNHLCIINAIKTLKENSNDLTIKLKLIGDGSRFEEMKNLVNELGLSNSVIFIGQKDSCFEDLSNADIFILPSLWEGMPMTLIEAMGTGLPIIASNVGGIPNMIINNREGILIQPNSDELIKAIQKLMGDISLRKKFGIHAKEKAQRFSSISMASNYIKIYERLS